MPTPRAGRAHAAAKNAAQIAEEQIRCYQLRLAGLTLDQIAKATGLSHGTVHARVKDEADSRVEPLRAEARQMELDRLDSWLIKLTEQIKAGKAVARNVEVAIRVSERRSKMLGLDEAEKVEATVHQVDHADVELAAMVREAQVKAAASRATLAEQRED